MLYFGIDYSITSPSICSFLGEKKDFSPKNCNFFYYNKRKQKNTQNNIHQTIPQESYKTPIQRFTRTANWAIRCIEVTRQAYDYPETLILIEDYSFGSKGKVFEIAENCGILKFLLEQENYNYQKISPTSLKKYATNSGKSTKEDMYNSFYTETQFDIKKVFSDKTTKNITTPISDIVDSYYLCSKIIEGL